MINIYLQVDRTKNPARMMIFFVWEDTRRKAIRWVNHQKLKNALITPQFEYGKD